MSMNFESPITPEQRAMIEELFGKPAAADDKTLLFDDMKVIESKVMGNIARATNQPVRIELHGSGEIRTLADGSRYEVTPAGWKKLT